MAVALDKLLKRQRLGVRICVVLRRADLHNGDDSIQNLLVKESLSHAVVTGTIMIEVLDALVNHGSVVAADCSGAVLRVAKLEEQIAQRNDILGHTDSGVGFSHSGGITFLLDFAGIKHHCAVVTKTEGDAAGRGTRWEVAGQVSVEVAMKNERGLRLKNAAMGGSSLQVAEDMLRPGKVLLGRALQRKLVAKARSSRCRYIRDPTMALNWLVVSFVVSPSAVTALRTDGSSGTFTGFALSIWNSASFSRMYCSWWILSQRLGRSRSIWIPR